MEKRERGVQKETETAFSLKYFFLPKNNHWSKRILLVFSFILFDYLSTLTFCNMPCEEANPYARSFMEFFGIPFGLTLFVLIANLPIYVTLSLDSYLVRLPPKMAIIAEVFVDLAFAWFVAGLHFSGGTSWFWYAPDLIRQSIGTFLYLTLAFTVVKPHKLLAVTNQSIA